jgi:zinc-binding alcohol dehydrogenase/oxidoreductase
VTGTNVGTLEDFKAMLAFVSEHRLEPVIERSFPLDDAAQALAFLQEKHRLGKIVITP